MKKPGLCLLIFVILCLMASGRPGSSISLAQHQPPAYDFSRVDKFLEESLPRMGAKEDSGCSLILIKDNRVIYRKAFGTFKSLQSRPDCLRKSVETLICNRGLG